jgi:hypothetical protein
MQAVPPATPFDDGAEEVLRQIAKDFEADEKLQLLLKRLGLQGKVPSPLATSTPGIASGPVAAAIARSCTPAALTHGPAPAPRAGWDQVHVKETRKGLPRIIWSNLHLAFVRMKDVKYKFSKDDQDYVAASPFMQMMLSMSRAAPGTTIVVQFSSGVEMHVDFRHMHGTDDVVRAPRPHPTRMPQAALLCHRSRVK